MKITLIPGFHGFPLLLGSSPKFFTRPPVPPESSPPSRLLLPALHPLLPGLSEITSSPVLQIHQTPRGCPFLRLGLCPSIPGAQRLPEPTRKVPAGPPCLTAAIFTVSLAGVPSLLGPSKAPLVNGKAEEDLLEILEGFRVLSPTWDEYPGAPERGAPA